MKLFMWFFKLHRYAEARTNHTYKVMSHKQRAGWALISGFGRAGVLWFS